MTTFECITRSELFLAPPNQYFSATRMRIHGAALRMVYECGMDERPSDIPWAIMGMGIVWRAEERREKLKEVEEWFRCGSQPEMLLDCLAADLPPLMKFAHLLLPQSSLSTLITLHNHVSG